MERMIVLNQKAYFNHLKDVYEFEEALENYKDRIVVLPSFIYMSSYINRGFTVGAQNVSDVDFGPFTGEVTISSLKDIGVKYVLIGHSEVRDRYLNENELIRKKISKALENDLKVILCIGEKRGEDVFKIIDECTYDIPKSVIISYEPIWSIGSDDIPSVRFIDDVVSYVKNKGFSKVLYGGSVNEKNIDVLGKSNVDGYLVGSASKSTQSIVKLIEVVK